MDKIDKLMGGSPGTEHMGTGKFEYSTHSIKFAPMQCSLSRNRYSYSHSHGNFSWTILYKWETYN